MSIATATPQPRTGFHPAFSLMSLFNPLMPLLAFYLAHTAVQREQKMNYAPSEFIDLARGVAVVAQIGIAYVMFLGPMITT